MRLLTAFLTLSTTRAGHIFRAMQTETNSAIPDVTIISGTGVAEAELPPDAGSTIVVPDFSTDQCSKWITEILVADADGSGGLSSDEFHDFLMSIEEPKYVSEYFDQHSDSYLALPWMFKVVFKGLACKCTALGKGSGCCAGRGAEMPFDGLTEMTRQGMSDAQQKVALEYRSDLCNSVAAVFQEVIQTPAPTKEPTPSPVAGDPAAVTTTVAPEPATEPPATEPPVTEPALTGPDSGLAFQCNRGACNVNPPSMDESSGWTSLGACAAGTEGGACPPAYDSETDYSIDDKISVSPDIIPATPATRMEIDIVGSVIDYSSFDWSALIFDGINQAGIPEFYNAEEIMLNAENNDVNTEIIRGFGILSTKLLGGMGSVAEEGKKRGLRTSRELQSSLGTLEPVQVTDIGEMNGTLFYQHYYFISFSISSPLCSNIVNFPRFNPIIACPEGLLYAPKDVYCLNFKLLVNPAVAADAEMINSFYDRLKSAIDSEGRLYDIVKEANPNTVVTGLGIPGKGIDYTSPTFSEPRNGEGITSANTAEETSGGLSTGAIVAIILCVILLPLAIIAMYARYRKVEEEKRQERLRAYNERKNQADLEAPPAPAPTPEVEPAPEATPAEDDESDAPSVWSESQKNEEEEKFDDSNNNEVGMTAGSALAAMGAAGAAAAMINKSE